MHLSTSLLRNAGAENIFAPRPISRSHTWLRGTLCSALGDNAFCALYPDAAKQAHQAVLCLVCQCSPRVLGLLHAAVPSSLSNPYIFSAKSGQDIQPGSNQSGPESKDVESTYQYQKILVPLASPPSLTQYYYWGLTLLRAQPPSSRRLLRHSLPCLALPTSPPSVQRLRPTPWFSQTACLIQETNLPLHSPYHALRSFFASGQKDKHPNSFARPVRHLVLLIDRLPQV